MQALVAYTGQTGQKLDYMFLLQSLMMNNPAGAVALAKMVIKQVCLSCVLRGLRDSMGRGSGTGQDASVLTQWLSIASCLQVPGHGPLSKGRDESGSRGAGKDGDQAGVYPQGSRLRVKCWAQLGSLCILGGLSRPSVLWSRIKNPPMRSMSCIGMLVAT